MMADIYYQNQVYTLSTATSEKHLRTSASSEHSNIQISLRVRAVWSKSSLGAFWIAKDVNNETQADLSLPWTHMSEDTSLTLGLNHVYIFSNLSSWNSYNSKTRPFKLYRKFQLHKLKSFRKKKTFSYFCSKHRLWVLVRTVSATVSNEYP